MLQGNQLEKAFNSFGITAKPRRKRKPKTWTCNKCGEVMTHTEGDNFIYCTNPDCKGNYFIFSK